MGGHGLIDESDYYFIYTLNWNVILSGLLIKSFGVRKSGTQARLPGICISNNFTGKIEFLYYPTLFIAARFLIHSLGITISLEKK